MPSKTKSKRRSQKNPQPELEPDLENEIDNSQCDSTVEETIVDYAIVIDKKKKSSVWNHFGQLFNNVNGNQVDEGYNFCNICLKAQQTEFQSELVKDVRLKPRQQILSIHKFKRGTSTTNLANHLSDVHKITEKDKVTYAEASKKLTEYFGSNSKDHSVNTKQIDPTYLLSRRLALLCARSLISYNALSSNSVPFTDFLRSYKIVARQGPDRRTLSRSALSDVYFEMIPVIKEIVKGLKYCAITLDLWTDDYKRNGYITFNLSCINDDFELLNINLKTGLMPIKHGAEQIAEQYFLTLKAFGIENVSIYVVSDKGSNVKKFINDEGLDHQYCLGHGIHNLINVDGFETVSEIDEPLKKTKKMVRKLRFRNPQLEQEDKNVRKEILSKIDEIDEAILKDLFEIESLEDDDEGFTATERLPLALTTLLDDESHPVKSIDKRRYKSVKGFTKTRWHSILIMLESLGTQRVAVNRVLTTIENAVPINTDEWDLIHSLISFLKIFQEAVESFSFEKKPTLSSALVFRIEIESTLSPNKEDHYLIAELKENMLKKLDYRFPITDEILIATLLDPRLQNLPGLNSELKKRKTTKFEFLKKEILKISPENVGSSQSNSVQLQSSESTAKKKKKSILSKLIEKHVYQSTVEPTNKDSKVDDEIHKYFLTVVPKSEIDDFNILSFWKNHKTSLPRLVELVKKILCIPVTSTSSERAFSYAGILINAKRSSLGPYVVEKTLFVHDNYDLVKKKLFEDIDCED